MSQDITMAEVILAYSNFRLPELVGLKKALKHDETGLLEQAKGRSPGLPSRDDGSAPDHSWRITDKQRADVRRLYATGLSITKIAKLTGMAWETARLILDAASDSSAQQGP